MAAVALMGVGRMGEAMARRFAGAGHDLVLWNRDRSKADQVAGDIHATVAPTPAEAASSADLIVSSLADDAALAAVYLGPDGVVAGVRPGVAAADTSTVDPGTIEEVGEAMDGAGAGFVDCPVSGSVSTVEAGGLTIMAGGDGEVVDRFEPLFSAVAKRVIRVGGRGSGAACKLAVNGLVHGLNLALAEALVLAERAGVDRGIAYEVFASGVGGAPFVQYKRDAYEHPETAGVAFSLDLVAKDLELINGLARRVGVPMRQAETNLEVVDQAIASGLTGHDMSALATYLRREAG